jgi:hypothetical protein
MEKARSATFRNLLLAGVAAAGVAFAAADAQAQNISTFPSGGIGTTPAINDVFGIREGIFGGNLFLISTIVPVNATIELIGFESGATNTFNINGGAPEFTVGPGQNGTIGSPIGTTVNVVLNPGLLQFAFTTSLGGGVINGLNVLPATDLPNFFVSFGATGDSTINGITTSIGPVLLIAFDDGGAGPDDNHDDLVIRLTLTPIGVPEPATLAMFGMGLLGLGLASRRRKA